MSCEGKTKITSGFRPPF